MSTPRLRLDDGRLTVHSTAAFCLSSATLNATLSPSLSLVRSIAHSYGTMATRVERAFHQPAHALSRRIIAHLVVPGGWSADPAGLHTAREVNLYSINVPLILALLEHCRFV